MDWIRENWIWIVIGGLFIWMHTRMHGGHGHGGHGGARGGGGGFGGHSHGRGQDEPSERKETQGHAEH